MEGGPPTSFSEVGGQIIPSNLPSNGGNTPFPDICEILGGYVDFLLQVRFTPDVGREGLGQLVQKPSRRRSPVELREEPDKVDQLGRLAEDLR